MGQTAGKKAKKMAPIPEEHLEKYIRSEFRAMAAENDDPNVLSRQQVLDLLVMLGYSKGKEKLKQLHVKNEDSIELDDYVEKVKEDKTLVSKTSRYRDVFQFFDKNNDGTASKEEIISGLESMDIKVDKAMLNTVEKMDANDDGKITYEEYLRTEFSLKMKKGEKSSKSSSVNSTRIVFVRRIWDFVTFLFFFRSTLSYFWLWSRVKLFVKLGGL